MSRAQLMLATVAVAALIGLGLSVRLDASGAAHAWLLGFVAAGLAPVGALVLIMIGRLTDASWGEELGPALRALAGAAPWLWLLGAPIALGLVWIYPWAGPPGPPAHLKAYLAPAPFLARAALALAGWTVLALLARRGRLGQRGAAAGLVFQAVVLAIVPNDWVLSLHPGWTTTDFGMVFLTLEVVAAAGLLLAFAKPGRAADDMAGFLIAGLLGLMYLTFMAYLVDWYGNLPDRIGWWIARLADGCWIALAAAFAAGLGALACLALGRRYRPAAVCALVGLAIYCAWLLSPSLGAAAWFSASCGLLFHASAMGVAALAGLPDREARRHG